MSANDDQPYVLGYWHEWEIDGRDRRVVLCVETALELRPGQYGFDRGRLDALIDQATRLMHSSASPIDKIRIVPALAIRSTEGDVSDDRREARQSGPCPVG